MSQKDTVNEEIKNILNERTKLATALNDISIIENVYPSDANFILVRVDDANRRYQELISKGIVVRNRTNQPLCENCLRFTVGNMEENNLLIKALKEL